MSPLPPLPSIGDRIVLPTEVTQIDAASGCIAVLPTAGDTDEVWITTESLSTAQEAIEAGAKAAFIAYWSAQTGVAYTDDDWKRQGEAGKITWRKVALATAVAL